MMALVMAGFGWCASPQKDNALQYIFDGAVFAPSPAAWAQSSDVTSEDGASEPIESEREWVQRTYTLRSSRADARM